MLLRSAAAGVCGLLAALAAVQAGRGWAWAPDVYRVRLEPGEPPIVLLLAQHAIHPRLTPVSLALGLEWERVGERRRAEEVLLRAAALDRRYLPAWTLANFYFRSGMVEEFWHWAHRAAVLCYDDFRPLLRLAEQTQAEPQTVVARLGDHPRLLRAYLDLLIGEQRWEHAEWVADLLRSHREPADLPRFEDLRWRLKQRRRSPADPERSGLRPATRALDRRRRE
jgi:hypothetical protein